MTTLVGVGVGPGDPELITVKALRLLRESPVVAYFVAKGKKGNAFGIIEAHLQGGDYRAIWRGNAVPDTLTPIGELATATGDDNPSEAVLAVNWASADDWFPALLPPAVASGLETSSG